MQNKSFKNFDTYAGRWMSLVIALSIRRYKVPDTFDVMPLASTTIIIIRNIVQSCLDDKLSDLNAEPFIQTIVAFNTAQDVNQMLPIAHRCAAPIHREKNLRHMFLHCSILNLKSAAMKKFMPQIFSSVYELKNKFHDKMCG